LGINPIKGGRPAKDKILIKMTGLMIDLEGIEFRLFIDLIFKFIRGRIIKVDKRE
jgi:hypothetical protein